MGTPQFAVTILEGLIESDYEVIAVVTQPDRPVGRKKVLTPTPVKELAVKHNIPVYQPEKLTGSEEAAELLKLKADLIVTAAYGQFVPDELLEAFPYKPMNVHASLLPKYRGGAPIHYAIWRGDQETGISIIYMTKKMDAGAILAQKSIEITSADDVGSLFEKLAVIGRDLLLETLLVVFAEEVKLVEQIEEEVIYSPTIKREEEQVNWNHSAQEIDWHVRAFRPFPSTHTYLDNQRVKLWDGEVLERTSETAETGTIISVTNNQVHVQCGQGTVYGITEWQESGKKKMSIKQWLNGNSPDAIIGKVFEYK